MKCSDVKKRLKAYHDGEMQPDEMKMFAEHLESCTQCADEAAVISQAWEMLLDLPGGDPAPDLFPGVADRISQGEGKLSGLRISEWFAGLRRPFAEAAALMMLMGFITGFGIAGLFQEGTANGEMAVDSQGEEIFFEMQDSSITNAYMTFIQEDGEETL